MNDYTSSSAEIKNKFTKILVAVDGSEASMDAADYAIEIGRKYDSQLIALYVILSDITLFGPNLPPHIFEIIQQAQAFRSTKQRLSDHAYDDKIHMRTEIISSTTTVGGIVNFAERENIDLIAIGTRGRSGFKKLLLGSVASGVVTYAHCPVMVVK